MAINFQGPWITYCLRLSGPITKSKSSHRKVKKSMRACVQTGWKSSAKIALSGLSCVSVSNHRCVLLQYMVQQKAKFSYLHIF